MRNYLINEDTLAILPEGTSDSLVIEKNNKFIVHRKPNNIIKANCSMHGSSLQGRLDGTRNLTGYTYKAPIIIEEKSNIIAFPTKSPRLERVAWIILDNVDCAYRDKVNRDNIIRFNDGQTIIVDSSLNILNNQILRATRLSSKLIKNNA